MCSQRYWNDVRDELDEIYSTSASFVRIRPPQNQKYWELSIDISQQEGRDLYGYFCYFYEDSEYMSLIPVIFRESKEPDAMLRLKYNDTIITQEKIRYNFRDDELAAVKALDGFEGHVGETTL